MSASSKDAKEKKTTVGGDQKLENRINIKDLEMLMEAFVSFEGDGYDNRLSLTREQFCETLIEVLNKGTRDEYGELFDKVDVIKEGVVDWDKLASHMLQEFYEKDDKVKSSQVPNWKPLRILSSNVHKDVIQKVMYVKANKRYVSISKDGTITMWGLDLRLKRTYKTHSEACRNKDLWVTQFSPISSINKLAMTFTSKEIAIYDMSSKLDLMCQYKITELESIPLCVDFWSNPEDPNEAILSWGDVSGCVNAITFSSATIALFERPSAPAGANQDPCLTVTLQEITKGKYKTSKLSRHKGHVDWVRQVMFIQTLECFISCATTNNSSLVIGWLEKSNSQMRVTSFHIPQGINGFDYNPHLNLIATAGVNHQVCLWNPYVVSKPNGVLRGHMASVLQVKFALNRNQLVSISKDKVLRIWDIGLQVGIQRLANIFPKGPEMQTTVMIDEVRNRLLITFNSILTVLEMRTEVRDRTITHEKPVVAAIYNSVYNQVVTVCQGGLMNVWNIDTGGKAKSTPNLHGISEITSFTQDTSETRMFSGSTDGTIKIWDLNGHCYHTLYCSEVAADIGKILVLKRCVLAIGWSRFITIFRDTNFKDFHVHPSDWRGGQEHQDDILCAAFLPGNTLATGAYDGDIVIWNMSSEQATRHINKRARKKRLFKGIVAATAAGLTALGSRQVTNVSIATKSDAGSERRPLTQASEKSTADEANELGYAVTRLIFLKLRKAVLEGANLISCGSNGWVRFWNYKAPRLVAEFIAHQGVGSIIMACDEEEKYLVTGCTDGVLKVWKIYEFCLTTPDAIITALPPLVAQWTPHVDSVTALSFIEGKARLLILSASADGSVALNDVFGNVIGVFGQEEHWKIEPIETPEEEEVIAPEEDEKDDHRGVTTEVTNDGWEPDEEATKDPKNYRVDSWETTILGKRYQEVRKTRRERRQPQIIPDLPYLHWERTGQPPFGPHNALEPGEISEVKEVHKPDFCDNPHKYFSAHLEEPASSKGPKQPDLTDALALAFGENDLFPKYILDYDSERKRKLELIMKKGARAGVTINSPSRRQGKTTGKPK